MARILGKHICWFWKLGMMYERPRLFQPLRVLTLDLKRSCQFNHVPPLFNSPKLTKTKTNHKQNKQKKEDPTYPQAFELPVASSPWFPVVPWLRSRTFSGTSGRLVNHSAFAQDSMTWRKGWISWSEKPWFHGKNMGKTWESTGDIMGVEWEWAKMSQTKMVHSWKPGKKWHHRNHLSNPSFAIQPRAREIPWMVLLQQSVWLSTTRVTKNVWMAS